MSQIQNDFPIPSKLFLCAIYIGKEYIYLATLWDEEKVGGGNFLGDNQYWSVYPWIVIIEDKKIVSG